MKKTILLTNDDGFDSIALKALYESLKDVAHVIVVAPSSERSACGHGLSITKPLKMIELSKDFYKLDDGTPTDCIYVALSTLFIEKKPDLIISGINIGSNLGEDTTYSGTVAGALEGCINGIKSIAISQVIKNKKKQHVTDKHFINATKFMKTFAMQLLDNGFSLDLFKNDRKLLNINIPDADKINGIKITNLGHRIYSNSLLTNKNPQGEAYHWIGASEAPKSLERTNHIIFDMKVAQNTRIYESNMLLDSINKEETANNKANENHIKCKYEIISDFKAITNNFISITPLKIDNTSYEDINELNEKILDSFKDFQ